MTSLDFLPRSHHLAVDQAALLLYLHRHSTLTLSFLPTLLSPILHDQVALTRFTKVATLMIFHGFLQLLVSNFTVSTQPQAIDFLQLPCLGFLDLIFHSFYLKI